MTSTKLMEILDENKQEIPDKLYLDMANLLKEKKTEENDDFKLVEIVYAELKIKRKYDNHDDGDYTAHVYQHQKQVYVFKRLLNRPICPSTVIKFSNIKGKEFMFIQDESFSVKTLYLSDSDENMLNVVYDKYTLMTISSIKK